VGAQSYRDLIVWQRSMDFVVMIYESTCNFPDTEKFGLTSQLRRAAVSIPSNIAEGQGRRTAGEFLNALSIAHGSLREIETQLMLAERLKLIQSKTLESLLNQTTEIGKMLNGLSNSLRKKRPL
jgi:four helix bundle protein